MNKPTGLTGFRALIIAVLVTIAAGCKSAPTVDAADTATAKTIAVTHAGGTVQRSIEGVAVRAGDSPEELLQRHLQFMAERGGPPLTAGNATRLLIDGPQTYAEMFEAMEKARDHINLEVYILSADEVGVKLLDLLKRKQAAGVQVNLIYDSLGSLSTPRAVFDDLIAAGVRVYEFNPIRPDGGELLDVNNRDHRKLLIVDGVVGFTGGINISSVYSQGSGGDRIERSKASKPAKEEGWRDTQIEVRGPAVAEMQKIFFDTWNQQEAAARSPQSGLTPNYFPRLATSGDRYVRVIASSPQDVENIIYVDLLTAIQKAERSIHLTMAYFAPDAQTIDALRAAALRGVDVVLVLPGFSDVWLVQSAGRSHYTTLLKAGVKIHERHDALVHAKTAVIDGVWSTVGSMNMDMRSFLHNSEVNAVVLGSGFGAEMEKMFQEDLAQATPVTLAQWRRRPLTQRLRELFARAWAYWL